MMKTLHTNLNMADLYPVFVWSVPGLFRYT